MCTVYKNVQTALSNFEKKKKKKMVMMMIMMTVMICVTRKSVVNQYCLY